MSIYREQQERNAAISQRELRYQASIGREQAYLRAREEKRNTPERRLRQEITDTLDSNAAVVVIQRGGIYKGKIPDDAGCLAAGATYTSKVKRCTRREIWYKDGSGKVVLTVSAGREFKGNEYNEEYTTREDIEGSDLYVDDVDAGQRLIFPGGFLNRPGDPQNARIEQLEGKKWKTIASAKQKTPVYQQLFDHFNDLWESRTELVPCSAVSE